ncbi:MucR family transcriptional regulator [Aquabacter sp. CN5-332]|uniref:MucR family transcriptional regulator n=1 Tax=Aquabacter sp. CN5-332 TaxID=3156608 RepID=UPI0032B353EF
MDEQPKNSDAPNFIELSADIVSTFVTNNSVAQADLAGLIGSVYAALIGIAKSQTGQEAPTVPLQPAVPIRKSVTPDFIVCLEDGKKFKSLKRHLRTTYDLTPEQYRAKWGLPADYPMVAPSYAAARSELAKQMGLGQQRKKAVAAKKTAPKRTKAS